MQDIIQWVNQVFGPHVDWTQVIVVTMTPLFILGFVAVLAVLNLVEYRRVD